MALDPVPWAIGGGAHNSVEGARLSLFAATGGKGGVMSPTDMQVTALPVPGGAVRVHTGGAVVISGYPGASSQAYAVREMDSTDVDITATGSSGSRRSYLVARIRDHQYSGEPAPDSVEDGPYNSYEWMSQHPRTNPPAYPVELLARVDQPANTQTITQNMITDMRRLANPRREEVMIARPRVNSDQFGSFSRTTADGGEIFPGTTGSEGSHVRLTIPEWCTQLIIEAYWLSVRYAAGTNPVGQMWVEFGDEYRPWTWPGNRQFERATQQFNFDSPGSSNNVMRTNWIVHDSVPVPKKFRGKQISFVLKAGFNTSASFGSVSMDGLSGTSMRVTYAEAPITEHAL